MSNTRKIIARVNRERNLAFMRDDYGRRNSGGASGFADAKDIVNRRAPKHRQPQGQHWADEY